MLLPPVWATAEVRENNYSLFISRINQYYKNIYSVTYFYNVAFLDSEKCLQDIQRSTLKRNEQRSSFRCIYVEPKRLFGTDDLNSNEGIFFCISKY